jgi:hypothetical protein
MWKVALPVLLALVMALPVLAQEAETEGERLFKLGRELMTRATETNNPTLLAEACDNFAKSYEAERVMSPLLNLARCEEARGRLRVAMKTWQQAADRARAEGDSTTLLLAQGAASSIGERLPKIVLRVPEAAGAAVLEIDGESAPRGVPFAVDPGEHKVTATLGTRVDEQTVTTKEGMVEVKLLAEAEAAPRPLQSDPLQSDAPDLATPGWVLLGISGAAWIAAATTSGVYLSRCDEPLDCVPNQYGQGGLAEANLALWIAAPLLSGVGATLLLVSAVNGEPDERNSAPAVTFDVTTHGLGIFGRATTRF